MTIWAAPCREVGVDGVEEHAPDVVLVLIPGSVADPDRAGVTVAGQVIEGAFGEIFFAADAVHDLQVPVA